MIRVELPNGDTAEAETMDAAMLAIETLIEDVSRWLRDEVAVFVDGKYDPVRSTMAQQAGMLC